MVCLGCGDDGPASPSIRVKDKLCIPQSDCDAADAYFLTFSSSASGDFAVSVHDATGARWSTVEAGSITAREEKDVRANIDDLPGSGGSIRITVVTGQGGSGTLVCDVGPNWEKENCR